MNKLNTFLLASTALTGLAATSSLAASSGNFSAVTDDFQCTINSADGTFNGNGSSAVAAGTVFDIFTKDITVQIANGAGTTLVVTPSLVTGLFTDNQITGSSKGSSIQDVGIQIQVDVTPNPGTNATPGVNLFIAPNTNGDASNTTDTGATCTPPVGGVASCVIYDQRFIEISSSVLQGLAACSNTVLVIGSQTILVALATCFELVESTLSAHAFNFYVQAPGGSYTFDVDAQLFLGKNNTAGAGSVAGCAGPGTVTVVQTKNFSFDSPISF